MPTLGDAMTELRKLFHGWSDLEHELDQIWDKVSTAEQDERSEQISKQIQQKRRAIREYLEFDLLRYPPFHYSKYGPALKDRVADYDKSVFIMTKFPEGSSDEDKRLDAVIAEVEQAIRDAGCVPQIANYGHQDWLWANVETFLLTCARGVAIVEDRCRNEMNPNVAFEWGWMKGMGKRVFFLMEKNFANKRADWQGLLSKTFEWANPTPGIRSAISEWLKGP